MSSVQKKVLKNNPVSIKRLGDSQSFATLEELSSEKDLKFTKNSSNESIAL